MELDSVFWNAHSDEMTQEGYLELKKRMLGVAEIWGKDPYPSWTETEDMLKAYGDYTSFSFHDESRSKTCWISFYMATVPIPERELEAGIRDRYKIINHFDIPCKRSVAIRDAPHCDEWRNHFFCYVQEPYGLQGVWVFEITTYSD